MTTTKMTYATLDEAKAVAPQGSTARRNAIKTYLREQREAKRAVKRVAVEPTQEEKLRTAINVALHHIALAYREAGMLPAPICDAKQTLQDALAVRRTLKLSGNMVDGTDRDLSGKPTLEGNCQ